MCAVCVENFVVLYVFWRADPTILQSSRSGGLLAACFRRVLRLTSRVRPAPPPGHRAWGATPTPSFTDKERALPAGRVSSAAAGTPTLSISESAVAAHDEGGGGVDETAAAWSLRGGGADDVEAASGTPTKQRERRRSSVGSEADARCAVAGVDADPVREARERANSVVQPGALNLLRDSSRLLSKALTATQMDAVHASNVRQVRRAASKWSPHRCCHRGRGGGRCCTLLTISALGRAAVLGWPAALPAARLRAQRLAECRADRAVGAPLWQGAE